MIKWINGWRANRSLSRAHEAVRAEQWQAARQASAHACDLAPQNLEALAVLGLATFRLGQYRNALDCYEEILLLKPGDASARRNMAMTLTRLGHWLQAFDLFKELAEERPGDFRIRKALAFIASKLNRPTPPPPFGEAVKQAIAAADWPRAISLASQMLQGQPDDVDAMLHLGVACYRSDRLEEARDWFGKAVEATRSGQHACRHAPALYNLATVCMKVAHWAEAVEALQPLQTMIHYNAPGTRKLKLANVLINLIVCFREQGQPRLAKAAYECLLNADPTVAAKIDPASLHVPLGAKLKSSAPLGAKLELAVDGPAPASEPAQQPDALQCSTCGAKVPPSNNFCGQCGAKTRQLVALEV